MAPLSLINADQLDDRHRVTIRGTEDRRAAGDFYLLRIQRSLKRKLRIGRWAAVVFEHPISKLDLLENFPVAGERSPRPADVSGYLVVHCKVDTLPGGEGAENIAEIDQTLRNSLGIPWVVGRNSRSLGVFVYPAFNPRGLGNFVSRWLGRRHIFFRVCSATVGDAEKNIARIPEEYFDVLGMKSGDRIIVERPIRNSLDRKGKIRSFNVARHSIKAHTASRSLVEERERSQRIDKRRYFPAQEYLYDLDLFTDYIDDQALLSVTDDNDIPSIFLDFDFRSLDGPEHKMTPLTAISVRRGLMDIFVREFQDFGLAFAIAAIPAVQGFYGLSGGDVAGPPIGYFALSVAIPLIVLAMIAWRIRRQII